MTTLLTPLFLLGLFVAVIVVTSLLDWLLEGDRLRHDVIRLERAVARQMREGKKNTNPEKR